MSCYRAGIAPVDRSKFIAIEVLTLIAEYNCSRCSIIFELSLLFILVRL